MNSLDRRLFSPTGITTQDIDAAIAKNPNAAFRIILSENLLWSFTYVRGLKQVRIGEWTFAEVSDQYPGKNWTKNPGLQPTIKTRDIAYCVRHGE